MALDNAAFQFDKLYSYLVPPSLAEQAVPGARVVVPFGRGDQPRVGVVMEEDSPSEGLKSLFFCEQHPLLDGEQVALIDYLKHNAFCAYFDAVRTILPKQLRAAVRCEDGSYSLADHRTAAQETVFFPGSPEGLTPLMRRVFPLVPSKGATRAELTALTGVSAATLAAMEKRGGLVRGARNKELAVYRRYTPREQPFTLFPEQQAAYDAIRARIEAGAGETLLYGVTSSGKTVVYMRLISDMLAQGRSSILLVPEIAIATQTIYRLREMFGDEVAVLHSGLSESERQLQWLAVREGKCRVVVGTRTAVFAPAQLLGLIIIDEQQESAYLSEQSPRFSAVAVARERRRLCGCHLLQGSATPSVSEYYHAGRHGGIVRLEKRYLGLPLPAVETVDMRQELLAALAGPLVNLVCGALFCMRSPAFAAYSLMLGIYNLLPVWPLDGGRAVRCALAQHLPLARAEAVSRRSSFAVCAALLLAGIILTFFRRAGLWPLGTAAYLTLRLLTLAKRTGE